MTCASFNFAGVIPRSRQILHSEHRGFANESLHFFRKMAAIPSGPDAELFRSSSMAEMMSSSVKVTLLMIGILIASSFVGRLLDL